MVTDLKNEFSDFYEVLTQIESIGKKLMKYKGNPNYKKSFNSKINLLDKKYILLERALSKQSNKELAKLFKKIKGDVETITSYKNPESAIEEIEFIKNKIWNKIEIQLDSEDNTLEERIYDENFPFDFHNDIIIKQMHSRSKIFLILLIVLIASFFRFYDFKNLPPGLYSDEAMNGNNALEAISTGNFKLFYPENGGREGLFINIQALSVYIFGNEPWALRSVSAIFGILTVLGVYLLALEIFQNNKKIALLSSFLIATSFWHINFSRIGFRAIMAPFFLIFAFYFLLKSVRFLKEKYFAVNGASEWKIFSIASLAGLFYGFGFHSYIAYRVTPLLLIAGFAYRLFYFKELRKEIIKILAVFVLFSFLAFLPL